MNIGFDAKRLYNNYTGLGNHSRTTIDILTEYFPENAYFLYTPKIRQNDTSARYLNKDFCTTLLPKGVMKGSLWRTLGLAGDVKRDNIDLFHGLSNELPMGLKVPSVVTIHDVAFHTFPDMYHWMDRQIYDIKWRYACKNADRIIAISDCTKRDIIKFYDVDEKKIDVVYQPVNPIYYKAPSNSPRGELVECPGPKGDYLLYIGAINSRKNLLGIVKALEMLPKDLRLPLKVVGNGHEYKTEVQKYIAEHGLEKWVEFLGSVVGTEELQKLYRGAKAFIYPSFYEGFGLPVVEALLSGCPVVTSNVSSLPEAGGPYSLKADPTSVEDISAKIQQVLTDDDLVRKISERGREWAMNTLHPEVLAKNLMNVYNKTLAGK